MESIAAVLSPGEQVPEALSREDHIAIDKAAAKEQAAEAFRQEDRRYQPIHLHCQQLLLLELPLML